MLISIFVSYYETTFTFGFFSKETTPVSTASSALSFGSLASNKSATLGRPPVISLVPEVSRGVLAITSPIPTLLPEVKLTVEFDGRR